MEEKRKEAEESEETEKGKKKKVEKKLPYCTTAPSAEHARGNNDNEPCDDGRTGDVDGVKLKSREDNIMHSKEELCEKIRSIYPDIGECGIDIDAEWNEEKNAWVIDLKKDEHELTTHLEPEDADGCMEGKQCISLGLQIAQLKSNIEGL